MSISFGLGICYIFIAYFTGAILIGVFFKDKEKIKDSQPQMKGGMKNE